MGYIPYLLFITEVSFKLQFTRCLSDMSLEIIHATSFVQSLSQHHPWKFRNNSKQFVLENLEFVEVCIGCIPPGKCCIRQCGLLKTNVRRTYILQRDSVSYTRNTVFPLQRQTVKLCMLKLIDDCWNSYRESISRLCGEIEEV